MWRWSGSSPLGFRSSHGSAPTTFAKFTRWIWFFTTFFMYIFSVHNFSGNVSVLDLFFPPDFGKDDLLWYKIQAPIFGTYVSNTGFRHCFFEMKYFSYFPRKIVRKCWFFPSQILDAKLFLYAILRNDLFVHDLFVEGFENLFFQDTVGLSNTSNHVIIYLVL